MRRIGLPILILATVLMQGLAYAQSTMVAKADVPFAFTAGGKTIAAGESVINTVGSTDRVLRVGNLDTNEAAYVVALTTESLAPAERTVLVRLWKSGTVEVATRDDQGDIWSPPVYLKEES